MKFRRLRCLHVSRTIRRGCSPPICRASDRARLAGQIQFARVTSLLFEATADGLVAIRTQGPKVRATIEPALGSVALHADGHAPGQYDLQAGFYVLLLEPMDDAAGGSSLRLSGAPGLAANTAPPAPARTVISFGEQQLEKRRLLSDPRQCRAVAHHGARGSSRFRRTSKRRRCRSGRAPARRLSRLRPRAARRQDRRARRKGRGLLRYDGRESRGERPFRSVGRHGHENPNRRTFHHAAYRRDDKPRALGLVVLPRGRES